MVQELILRPHVLRYRRERWITPDGRTVVAALPAGTVGHFGPELRRFVLAQYHQGQVTVPRIVAHLRDLGMAISKRQVVRLLIAGKEDFLAEAAGVLNSPVMKSLIDQSVSGATMITSIAGLPSMFATMAIARAASN